MAYQGLQSFKANNERKTVFLMILFPVFLFVVCLLATTFLATDSSLEIARRFDGGRTLTLQIFIILLPIIAIRGLITFYFQKEIMFKFSGAKELTRTENPEIYNIVENLCISRGLPMPKI